ncbi:MAG: hypothetical protein AAF772_08220 [Acidobacteriota bacterium]
MLPCSADRPFPSTRSFLLRTWLCAAALVALAVVAGGPALAQPVVIQVPGDAATLTAAVGLAPDGGIVEFAAGTYLAPSGGFVLNNINKRLTIRGAVGAQVTLSGANAQPILRLQRTAPDPRYTVVFENLIFANGRSSSDGIGGAITMTRTEATFVDVIFRNNNSQAPTTGGGGLLAFDSAVVHLIDTTFEDNLARNEGAGVKMGEDTQLFVLRSVFDGNRTNVPGHRPSSAGGGIHIGNGDAWIAESRFVGNIAGCVGGGVYVLGSWQNPIATPRANLTVTNSLFEDNAVEANPGVNCSFTGEGGAIHTEDQATATIVQSRFLRNRSPIGGGVTLYRSIVDIRQSLFRGNRATGTGIPAGFGGAIQSNSNDANDASTGNGTINRRSAQLTVRDSFFQGRFGAIGTTGNRGGCIFAQGDTNRTYGRNGVSMMGGPAVNRAPVTIEDSVFFDCDVQQEAGVIGTGAGGGLQLSHVDLNFRRNLVARSDALGSDGNGGGMRTTNETLARIEDSTFIENDGGSRGGALLFSSSEVMVDGCIFANNEAGGGEGAAIWAAAETVFGTPTNVFGTVTNSDFGDHPDLTIRDFDFAAGPFNNVRYSNNTFFTSAAGGSVYRNFGGALTPAGINTFASRGGVDKGSGNGNFGAEPPLGGLVVAPSEILFTVPPGEPAPPTDAFATFAWAGSSAQLNGQSQGATAGFVSLGDGVQTLQVTAAIGTESYTDTTTDGAIPAPALRATPASIMSGQSSSLGWSAGPGAFLGASVDRGVASPASANGASNVTPPASQVFRYLVFTRQGGADAVETVFVDEAAAEDIFDDGFESASTVAWSSTTGGS